MLAFALESLTSLAVCSKDLINLIVVVDETGLVRLLVSLPRSKYDERD